MTSEDPRPDQVLASSTQAALELGEQDRSMEPPSPPPPEAVSPPLAPAPEVPMSTTSHGFASALDEQLQQLRHALLKSYESELVRYQNPEEAQRLSLPLSEAASRKVHYERQSSDVANLMMQETKSINEGAGGQKLRHSRGGSSWQKSRSSTAVESCAGDFQIHSAWEDRLSTVTWGMSSTKLLNGVLENHNEDQQETKHSSSRCTLILEPQSPYRLFFDFIGALFVCYDLVWIPMQLLSPEEGTFIMILSWFARLFWTVDLVINFFTSYFKEDGRLETNPRNVARRYLRSWFPTDLFVVASDWAEVLFFAFSDVLSMVRFGKVARTVRVLRMIRLVRAFKVGGVLGSIMQKAFSERVLLFVEILKAVFCVITVAHLMACSWCGLGLNAPVDGWVVLENWKEFSLLRLYVLSYHWAIAAFTGTSITLGYNFSENFFAALSMLFGFVLSAAFVSSVTTAMTRLQMLGVDEQRQFADLRHYLQNQGCSSRLVVRITQNAKLAVQRQRHMICEKDVTLLALVSEPLLIDLHYEIYAHVLQDAHPLFAFYSRVTQAAMKSICHQTMSIATFSKGDVVFHVGERETKPQTRCVMTGELFYQQDSNEDNCIDPLDRGTLISEALLWTKRWMHIGTLTAKSECKLITVDAGAFQQTAADVFEGEEVHPSAYAAFFVERLNALSFMELSDIMPAFGLPDVFEERLEAGTGGGFLSPRRNSILSMDGSIQGSSSMRDSLHTEVGHGSSSDNSGAFSEIFPGFVTGTEKK
eukprot:TRINITY_DN29572_c0_g1_i2.p1 TRINITY_DN29572_c0_g1~~TRINITY_DN29572_c0_g1_i2.p1  ORF type:complete len:760 (-),score=150.42 TRINITY_DN29572_c0_g1_i2:245-2524(-)